MGYPASAASLLKALTDEGNSYIHRDAIDIVSKFSLFVIILADPVKDPVFYERLQESFQYYDRLTGQNLLFFSIVKEADEKNSQGRRKEFRIFNDISAYKENHAAEEVQSSELVIHSICNLLGVDYDQTPCLIISNDLRFGRFFKVNTDINNLERQLIVLRGIADELKNNPVVPIQEILRSPEKAGFGFLESEEIDLKSDTTRVLSEVLQSVSDQEGLKNRDLKSLWINLTKSVSFTRLPNIKERIFEAMSLLSTGDNGGHFLGRNKVLHANPPSFRSRILNTSDSDYSNFRNHFNDENRLSYLASLSFSNKIKDEWQNVQPSTKNYLKQAHKLIRAMQSSFAENEDYSLYVFSFCKSFEVEINYSIVQLMRNFYGIRMPEYFFKYCPEKDNIPIRPDSSLVSGIPRIIYLNSGHDGKWHAPGLGESRLVFDSTRNNSPKFGTDWQPSEMLNSLSEKWQIVQKIRNKASHTEMVNLNDKKNLEMALTVLIDKGVLNSLTALKRKLGDDPTLL